MMWSEWDRRSTAFAPAPSARSSKGPPGRYVALSRDTTEADLKQRREIRADAAGRPRTTYADAAPVRAAMFGRVLILDGLEKAERNVLPTLNNLLENLLRCVDVGRLPGAVARKMCARKRETGAPFHHPETE